MIEETKKRGRPRKYATDEETIAVNREKTKDWFNNTKEGRAYRLARNYKETDKRHRRGNSTVTAQWIMDNIFTSKCHWCGENDWKLLGCDRIDNNLPHSPDNVICSCVKCNKERNIHTVDYFTKFQRSKLNKAEQLKLF